MALHVLAYNLTGVINIVGVVPPPGSNPRRGGIALSKSRHRQITHSGRGDLINRAHPTCLSRSSPVDPHQTFSHDQGHSRKFAPSRQRGPPSINRHDRALFSVAMDQLRTLSGLSSAKTPVHDQRADAALRVSQSRDRIAVAPVIWRWASMKSSPHRGKETEVFQ
jgi:hypothetical protein